jgi:hypothetical protein
MRHDSIEIHRPNARRRTRRVWYGHGSCRVIADSERALPPADVIDEAMASFERVDAAARPKAPALFGIDRPPLTKSLMADLSSQLSVLDRQRDQLARLLREIS